MNIVVFGGTFDPIHNGHIRIARAAAKKYDARVIFVPAKTPRWKEPTESVQNRLEMLKIALKDADFEYEINEFELNGGDEINYSIDTVKHLKEQYKPENIYLLIGYDQVNQFDKWKNPEELAKISKVIFVNRPGYEVNKEIIKQFNMENVGFFDSGDVSSTDVRELRSLDIPEKVLKYIEENRLYFVKKLSSFIPEKRLEHSISVANLALKVAKVNNLEHQDKFYIAGILHDLGKTYNKDDENLLTLMKENYPEFLDIPNFAYHQFVGEMLAKREFDVKDEEILDAIKYHCTGKSNMSQLGMVIYASDKIDPLRDFDSTWLMNSCFNNWKQGFLDTLEDNKKYLLSHKKDIENRLTAECFEMYLK